MTRILYLTYDLNDAATVKRVRMLTAGGATVQLMGFRRTLHPITSIADSPAIDLGRTHNGKFLHRIACVIRELFTLQKHQPTFEYADIIIARNLEMLILAVRGKSLTTTNPKLIYESLDIHRLLLREDIIGKTLRTLERCLAQHASALITSSPAFIREYFTKRTNITLPTLLVENKVFTPTLLTPPHPRATTPPWRIGWFGVLRCQQSLDILTGLARAHPNSVEIIIRGRPAHDQLPNFDAQIRDVRNIHFLGSYTADELPAIYHDIHFSWAIDMFEENLNSAWLLPNRIYEGCLHGAVPLAASNTETSNFITRYNIGHTLAEPKLATLTQFLTTLTPEKYQSMQQAVASLPRETWLHTTAECAQLVSNLAPPAPVAIGETPAIMVVIPCLNEIKTIQPLVDYLISESIPNLTRIVIADGGSTDGTVDTIQQLAARYEHVTYLPNPKRIQSAALNLAVATYGHEAQLLIRMDAHADYPKNFCADLIHEATTTNADSIVISLVTIGAQGFQAAAAAAQNSKLGTGNSAHRHAQREGKWVDHGHHALMRISAYRAVGGYDENFTHNEDAELDTRLRFHGYRIWLTAKTKLHYHPRATPLALFRQYRNYGSGRLRNLLKHRTLPKLRQMLPVAVAPAIALLILSPLFPIAALPFTIWVAICISYGSLIAYRAQNSELALSGPAAMIMHSAWSLGFWHELLTHQKRP